MSSTDYRFGPERVSLVSPPPSGLDLRRFPLAVETGSRFTLEFPGPFHWSRVAYALREELRLARKWDRRHVLVFYSLDVIEAAATLAPEDRSEIAVYRLRDDGSEPTRFTGEELVTVVRERMEIR